MNTITTIGLDIAKSSFAAHCCDAAGKTVKKVQLKRSQVLGFFAGVARCRERARITVTLHLIVHRLRAIVGGTP